MSKDTGGQSFPHYPAAGYEAGMTLRDYFAAKAMQAMLTSETILATSNDVVKNTNERRDSWIAGQAYSFADAMIAERAK